MRAVAKVNIFSSPHILQLHWHVNSLLLLNTQCSSIRELCFGLHSLLLLDGMECTSWFEPVLYLIQFESVPGINFNRVQNDAKASSLKLDYINGSFLVLRIIINNNYMIF